jgi:hypothetical protein
MHAGKTMDIQQFTAWVQEQNPAEYKSQDAQPIVLGQYVPYVEQKDQILQRAKWFSKLDSVFSSFLSSNEHQGQHFDLYSLLRDVMDTHNVRCFKFSHGGNECWAPAECAGVHLKEVKIQLPVHRVTQEEIGQGPDMHRDGWCMLPWSYGPAHFPSLCSALTSLYGQPRVRVDYNAGMQELFVEVFAGVADGSLPKLLLIFERGHLEEGEVAYEYTDQAEWDLSDEWVEPEPFT